MKHRLAGPLKYNSCPLTIHLNPVCHKACKNKNRHCMWKCSSFPQYPPDINTDSLRLSPCLPALAGLLSSWVEFHPPTCWWSWFLRQHMKHSFALASLVSTPTPWADFTTRSLWRNLPKQPRLPAHSEVERIYDAKYFSGTLKQICTSTLGLSLCKCWTI